MIAEAVAGLGDSVKLFIGPFAHERVHKLLVVFGVLVAELIEHVADGLIRADLVYAVADLDHRLFNNVVLVPYLADELLKDILPP